MYVYYLLAAENRPLTLCLVYQEDRTIADNFARFEVFLRRETTRQLEARLPEVLDGDRTIEPTSSMSSRLLGMVNEIQLDAMRTYHRQISSSESVDQGSAEGSEEVVEEGPDGPERASPSQMEAADLTFSNILLDAIGEYGLEGGLEADEDWILDFTGSVPA